MNIRTVVLSIALFLWACPQVRAQQLPLQGAPSSTDFNEIVLSITELKLDGSLLEAKFGSGFCLDVECHFIVTNYHVDMIARPRKIHGDKIIKRYQATGPDDEGATVNHGPSIEPMKYTLSRDLSIYELRHGLTHYHGISFSLEELEEDQEVEIYSYPKEGVDPVRGLEQFHGTFKGPTADGLLAFAYSPAAGKRIRPGASGGVVVEAKSHKIVGILNGLDIADDRIALAVSVQSLADFVRKIRPCLAQKVFPPSNDMIPPDLGDLNPKLLAGKSSLGAFQRRVPDSSEVQLLRTKAQQLADSMKDFIAVQTFAWGSGTKPPVAESAYEVRVVDGFQRFREYPNGKKELRDAPLPPVNTAMSTGGEWSELPQMVGTERGFKIHRASDTFVAGRRIEVFQFQADREDDACSFKSIFDFGFFALNKIATVGCYGEVWTDQDMNILRISLHLELSGKWKNYQSVVTYGWLRRSGEVPRLIPFSISAQAEYNKKVYWCRGRFMDYQVFSSRVKVAAN